MATAMTTTTSTLPPAMEVRSACSCCGQSQLNNMLGSQLACGHMQAIVEEVQLKNTNFLTFNSKRDSGQRVCCSDGSVRRERIACVQHPSMHAPTHHMQGLTLPSAPMACSWRSRASFILGVLSWARLSSRPCASSTAHLSAGGCMSSHPLRPSSRHAWEGDWGLAAAARAGHKQATQVLQLVCSRAHAP